MIKTIYYQNNLLSISLGDEPKINKMLPITTFFQASFMTSTALFLLIGAIKRNTKLLKFFVIISLASIIFLGISGIMMAIAYGITEGHNASIIIICIVLLVIGIGFCFYIMICVNSFLMELIEGGEA